METERNKLDERELDKSELLKAAQQIYAENLQKLLSICSPDKKKVYQVNLDDLGVILGIKVFKVNRNRKITSQEKNVVLFFVYPRKLIPKSLAKFGKISHLNEQQQNLVNKMEKDVQKVLLLPFIQKEMQKVKDNNDSTVLKTVQEEINNVKNMCQKSQIKIDTIKEKKKAQVLDKFDENKFENLLMREKVLKFGEAMESFDLVSAEEMQKQDKYFKYFYRVNNVRFQYIVIY
eukprot:snap_masked-scaffold_14-processed-gene-8.3-mRNA-1 protein AED:0.47 eAED:1.00 QI:0/-1/0/1/-1/1/1/0/232